MDKKLLELSVELVQAQISLNKMSGEEIESTLIKVYNVLHKMQQAEQEGRPVGSDGYGPLMAAPVQAEPANKMDPRTSIEEGKVTCLECGVDFRQLTANHLRTHGMSPREYKRKWGFPLKQPLAARDLTRTRSLSAKQRGLPPKLQQYLEDQRQKKEVIPPSEVVPSRRTARGGAA